MTALIRPVAVAPGAAHQQAAGGTAAPFTCRLSHRATRVKFRVPLGKPPSEATVPAETASDLPFGSSRIPIWRTR